jgi:hypothetical protein
MFGMSLLEEIAATLIAIWVAFISGLAIGAHHENLKWKAQAAKDELVYEQHLSRAKDDSIVFVDHYVQGDAQVQTVFKDRIVYRTKEIPHEVIVRSDSACGAIPAWFVGMWNSANQARLPNAADALDGGPTNVVLSDISAQHDREAETCIREEKQLAGLKTWVRNTYRDINDKPAPY